MSSEFMSNATYPLSPNPYNKEQAGRSELKQPNSLQSSLFIDASSRTTPSIAAHQTASPRLRGSMTIYQISTSPVMQKAAHGAAFILFLIVRVWSLIPG